MVLSPILRISEFMFTGNLYHMENWISSEIALNFGCGSPELKQVGAPGFGTLWCRCDPARIEQCSTGALHLIVRIPVQIKKKRGLIRKFQMSSKIALYPHPQGVRLWSNGFSHGLTKCPPDTWLPCLRQGRPLRVPQQCQKEPALRGWLFLVPLTGLEPVQYRYRGILSPLCLPIPPQRRLNGMIPHFLLTVKSKDVPDLTFR